MTAMYKGMKWFQDKQFHLLLKIVAVLIIIGFLTWYFDFDERFGHLFKFRW